AELLDMPASELTGRIVPLHDLSRDFARNLAPPGEPGCVPDLEAQLLRLARAPADPIVGEAVRQLAGSHGRRDIASLAREFGVSTRHLERRFLDRVGLQPKLFARMRRFQSVFAA